MPPNDSHLQHSLSPHLFILSQNPPLSVHPTIQPGLPSNSHYIKLQISCNFTYFNASCENLIDLISVLHSLKAEANKKWYEKEGSHNRLCLPNLDPKYL